MSTNYPTSLDSLTNPSPSDSMATVSHSGQHTNANDAIEALQAKVGVDSSAVTTSLDYRVAQLELGGGGGGGASVTVSDTAPSSPSEGDLWFESDTGDILVYYGSAWVDVGGTSVANIAVQSTAPTSPVNGDLWFDTDTAQTFVWYDDGTSTQWVEVGAASAAASGTDGAVQFASGGTFSSDASNLVWDDTNNRLGIGTSTPTVDLEVAGTVKAVDLVGNVTATSVSTTNLTVDTDTLYVDSLINAVGIGDTTPSYKLDVNGDINSQAVLRQAGAPIGMVRTMTVGIGSGVSYVDVSNCFSSSYNKYVIHYSVDSATQETQFGCQLRSGGTVVTSGYKNQLVYLNFSSSTVQTASGTSLNRFVWLGGMKGGSGSSWHSGTGAFILHNPYLSNYYTFCESGSYGATTTGGNQSGIHQTQASYDGFRFYVDIGTISGGRIDVYGMTI